jgi:hypothetical protein
MPSTFGALDLTHGQIYKQFNIGCQNKNEQRRPLFTLWYQC